MGPCAWGANGGGLFEFVDGGGRVDGLAGICGDDATDVDCDAGDVSECTEGSIGGPGFDGDPAGYTVFFPFRPFIMMVEDKRSCTGPGTVHPC